MSASRLLRPAALFLAFLATASAAVAQLGDERVGVSATLAPSTAASGSEVTLRLELSIQPGWHVYGARHEMPTEVRLQLPPGVSAAGAAVIPDGMREEKYGIVSYALYGEAVITQRLRVDAGTAAGELAVKGAVHYQACDENMCEPPTEAPFAVALQVTAAAPAPAQDPGGFDATPPRVEATATIEPARAAPGSTVLLRVRVEPQDGWHVYGAREAMEPTRIEVADGAGLSAVGQADVPDGERHEKSGIETYWLAEPFEITWPVRIPDDAADGTRTLRATVFYTACTEEFCERPTSAEVRAEVAVDATAPRVESGAMPATPAGETGMLAFLLLAIGAGLFALVMPCTYPMIPITISFFTKQAEARGGRVLSLSLTYGIGIVLMFVVIGVLLGAPIQRFATHPVTNLVIAVAFLVFGLSLFGAIDLRPPQFLMNAAGKAQSQGGVLGVFLMGVTLVVTSFTCTAPFVGTILSVGAGYGTGQVALGMGVFGLTMAVPFVLLSLLPGTMRSLPRSGEWMNVVKVFFGFIEIAAAFKFLSNADLVWQWQALPRELFLWLWVGIFGTGGLYLLGMIRLKDEDGRIGPLRLVSGLGTLLFALYCLFGAMGNPMDRIMTAIIPNYSVAAAGPGERGAGKGGKLQPQYELIKDDYERARLVAQQQDKLLLLNFTGYS